jgi:glycine reductase
VEVEKQLKIPTITAMNNTSPAVDMYKKHLFVIETTLNARSMKSDLARMVSMARKKLAGEWVGFPDEGHYYLRGYKRLVPSEKLAATRVVDMALDKYYGRTL